MIDKVKFKNDQWNKLSQWSNENKHLQLVNDDTYAFSILQSLLIGYPYIPFNTFAYRPYALALILNEIIINQRKSIIEFGSGISTIMIGRLIQKNKLDAKLLSIEHDQEWYYFILRQVEQEGLSDSISIEYQPLSENNNIFYSQWYNVEGLKKILVETHDFMIVDGPPGFPEENKKARFPALPVLADHLAENHCILLDDSDRDGERGILNEWAKDYDYNFHIISKTIGLGYKGTNFFSFPTKQY